MRVVDFRGGAKREGLVSYLMLGGGMGRGSSVTGHSFRNVDIRFRFDIRRRGLWFKVSGKGKGCCWSFGERSLISHFFCCGHSFVNKGMRRLSSSGAWLNKRGNCRGLDLRTAKSSKSSSYLCCCELGQGRRFCRGLYCAPTFQADSRWNLCQFHVDSMESTWNVFG